MILKKLIFLAIYILFWGYFSASHADTNTVCRPQISFINYLSPDLEQNPPTLLTIKGKLILPVRSSGDDDDGGCFQPRKRLRAVIILHGSEGVGFQGKFYAEALNAVGIATLEIDMWEPRGVLQPLDRPPLPLFNYPDAFGALKFLSNHPNIDKNRIGVIGFSWGAVISLASATELYTGQFGGGLRFSAHVANYPICYAYNNPFIPGSEFVNLTGAPVLIQIGDEDDYDLSSAACFALKDSLSIPERKAVQVIEYKNAFHEWDRLLVPATVKDPFSNLGAGGDVELVPNPAEAYRSRANVVKFFRLKL